MKPEATEASVNSSEFGKAVEKMTGTPLQPTLEPGTTNVVPPGDERVHRTNLIMQTATLYLDLMDRLGGEIMDPKMTTEKRSMAFERLTVIGDLQNQLLGLME